MVPYDAHATKDFKARYNRMNGSESWTIAKIGQ